MKRDAFGMTQIERARFEFGACPNGMKACANYNSQGGRCDTPMRCPCAEFESFRRVPRPIRNPLARIWRSVTQWLTVGT